MKGVPDASFTGACAVPSQFRPEAAALIRSPGTEWVAPSFMLQEVFSAYVDAGALARPAYALAQTLNTSVFDTVYLLLAESLDAELWTLDQRFIRAASPRFAQRLRTLG